MIQKVLRKPRKSSWPTFPSNFFPLPTIGSFYMADIYAKPANPFAENAG